MREEWSRDAMDVAVASFTRSLTQRMNKIRMMKPMKKIEIRTAWGTPTILDLQQGMAEISIDM